MWVFTAGRFVVSQLAGATLLRPVVMEHQQRRLFSAELHNNTELHMKLWTSLVRSSKIRCYVLFWIQKNLRVLLPRRAGAVLSNFGEWGKAASDVGGSLQDFRRNGISRKGLHFPECNGSRDWDRVQSPHLAHKPTECPISVMFSNQV